MADIDWPDNNEEAVLAVVKNLLSEHHKALYGNGQPGILDFISGLKGQMRLIVGLLLFLSTLAAIGTLLVGIHAVKTGRLDAPAMNAPNNPAFADNQQDATNPTIYTRR